jgi:uncharacterized protein (TIGR02996 family)
MAQHPDWLMFEGRRRMMETFPLEAYLRELPARPDLRFTENGNPRGYVAGWEMRDDDTLWLVALQTQSSREHGVDPGLRLLFDNSRGPVLASWVHMRLRFRDSGQQRFNPFGNTSMIPIEYQLLVWEGRLISTARAETSTGRIHPIRCTPQLEAIFGAEEAAFLRAIAMNPRDSAPKLIYADWLQERDDPRSDLIRINERLRAMGATGPIDVDQVKNHAVGGRQFVLWKQLIGYDEHVASPASQFDGD